MSDSIVGEYKPEKEKMVDFRLSFLLKNVTKAENKPERRTEKDD